MDKKIERRVSKGVNDVLRSKDPDRSFNGRPYAVQPLRDTAARDVFLCALTRIGSKGKT
jgi:hypothetical protein